VKTVKKLLKEKESPLWSITPDIHVLDALKLMAGKDIGALLVVDGSKLAGIFSERDYARKVILKGKASHNTPVKEIMTVEVVTVQPQQTIDECMAIMERNRIRYLPVIDNGKLIGIISIGDVLQSMISEQAESINQLQEAGIFKNGSDL
jgi:CBS domain-containing protein